MANAEQKGMLLAGTMLICIQNPDNTWPKSFFDVETDALSIGASVEFVEALSKRRNTYNQPFVSIPLPQPADFNVTFSEVNRKILAMKLAGILTPVTSTASPFTGIEVETVAGEWVEIGRAPIAEDDTFKVADDASGTTVYVEDVDYEVNRAAGLLLAIPGGAIADGASVHVSGTEAAVSDGARIDGMARAKTVIRFILDGYNLADGRSVKLSADRVVIANSDAIDFLSSEIMTAPLTGRMEIPGRNKPPFRLEWL